MTPPIAFDPAAQVYNDFGDHLAEVTLTRAADDRLTLTLTREQDDQLFDTVISLRPDFLDALIAARAREAAA